MSEYIDVPIEIKADDITDSGEFKGIASTFGGKPDSHGDVIQEGAFAESLINGGRNGNGVAMLYSHIPSEPIGVWKDIRETKKGLAVVGKLSLGVRRADETHILMKDGAIRGLSIGFSLGSREDWEYDPKKDIRILKKINLWEISPVVFPSNTRAKITGVKNDQIIDLLNNAETIREVEGILRDAGFSKKVSKMICAWNKAYQEVSGRQDKELLESLKDLNRRINDAG